MADILVDRVCGEQQDDNCACYSQGVRRVVDVGVQKTLGCNVVSGDVALLSSSRRGRTYQLEPDLATPYLIALLRRRSRRAS